MTVTLSNDVLRRYPRFSLYNSPYPAHDRGCAIDLYPGKGALSPVAGEVIDTRTVRAPSKPYSPEHDHLILVDCGEYVARILHVDPVVSDGDRLEIGDSLGELVRAGFFAPWVGNHIHLGFRPHDLNPYRASGSLPIKIETDVEPVGWNGAGPICSPAEFTWTLDFLWKCSFGIGLVWIGLGWIGPDLLALAFSDDRRFRIVHDHDDGSGFSHFTIFSTRTSILLVSSLDLSPFHTIPF